MQLVLSLTLVVKGRDEGGIVHSVLLEVLAQDGSENPSIKNISKPEMMSREKPQGKMSKLWIAILVLPLTCHVNLNVTQLLSACFPLCELKI